MRKVAAVRGDPDVARLVLYATRDCVYVFPCASDHDGSAFGDEWFETLGEAEQACKERYGVGAADWTDIEDPRPHCQHDWIEPVRVVGRDKGSPQWGRFERLEDGAWVEIERIDDVWQARRSARPD
jgi:hypothetical protein